MGAKMERLSVIYISATLSAPAGPTAPEGTTRCEVPGALLYMQPSVDPPGHTEVVFCGALIKNPKAGAMQVIEHTTNLNTAELPVPTGYLKQAVDSEARMGKGCFGSGFCEFMLM